MQNSNHGISFLGFILLPISNVVLVVFAALILFFGITILNVIEWLLSNVVAIVVGIGCFFIFVYFVGTIYSYITSTKAIKNSYSGEEAQKLLFSKKRDVLLETRKVLYLMIAYALSWTLLIVIFKYIV